VSLAILASILFVFAYLCGSLPTGYLFGKYLKGIDIRTEGSGSTGATNVLRTLGKVPGAIVLALDISKGVLAVSSVTISSHWVEIPHDWQGWLVIMTASSAILGHSKSVWLGFTGGKSVATSLGVLLAMSPVVGAATLGTFLLCFAVTRIVSVGSIVGAVASSIFFWLAHYPLPYILFAAIGGGFVVWRHRANIERIFNGTEPKIGEKIIDNTQA
jgi:acyl phosphate:glycerol-3-phosphate acyltransferase